MSCTPRCRYRLLRQRPSQPAPDASAISRSAPAVEDPVERPRDALAQTVDHGAAAPLAAVELLRIAAVGREGRRRLRRERGALDLLVRLQIPAEAPTVEIARADAQPVVAQSHL